MKKYDNIVIGSGIGGLAVALMLVSKGKKVLVMEKNKDFGGRLSSTTRDGFVVDFGVHVISRSENGPLGEVLARAGVESKLKFTKVRPLSSYNGEIFVFPRDLAKMIPEADYNALMQFMQDIYAFSDDEVSGYDDISIEEFLNKYTKDSMCHACIANLSFIYCALTPWDQSAGEFMRCLRMEAAARSSGYPLGGCGKIVEELVAAIRERGGEVYNNMAADQIIIENNKAVGVVANNEKYFANTILSNADIKNTVLNLVGEQYFDKDYVEYVKNLKYSWAGCVLRIGLDTVITDLKLLTQIGTLDRKKYYEDLRNGIIPEQLNLMIVSPSSFSPGIAPEGKQMLNIGALLPLDLPIEVQNKFPEAMIKTTELYMPGLSKHILWKEYTSVSGVAARLGEDGAGIGIGQMVGQVGKNRPTVKTSVEGLYIVGGEAGGVGVGIELAINSALEYMDNYAGK